MTGLQADNGLHCHACFGGLSRNIHAIRHPLIQFASKANFDAALALLGHDSLITAAATLCQSILTRRGDASLFVDAIFVLRRSSL